MTDNIIDFEKKSEEILLKQITDFSDVAELVIGACFADGQNDYELAVGLLFENRVADKHEELLNTMLSMEIAEIERKGYWVQANELRKRLNAHLDKQYEKAIKEARDKGLGEGIETYKDPEKFLDELTKEEQTRIESVVHKLFDDEIDFSELRKEEAFEILKDDAKYCFYYGDLNMKELVIDNKRLEISLTFMDRNPILGASKNAFAYLFNIFDEVWISTNKKSKTITANFCFYNIKKEGK